MLFRRSFSERRSRSGALVCAVERPDETVVFSLLFGVIHLFVGLGIKGYLCLKDGKVMDFFCDVVLWFMLLIGLILMLLPRIFLHLSHR